MDPQVRLPLEEYTFGGVACPADSTPKCSAFERPLEHFLRRAIAEPLPRPAVEFVFDVLDEGVVEGGQVAAFGEVLAKEAVAVLVGTALPRRVRIGEVALGRQGDVDERVLGELAAVVPRYGVDTGCQRMQRVDDGSRDGLGLAVGYAPDSGEAGLSVGQRDQAGGSLAHDGVTLPVADAPTCFDARWPLSNAATVKALALPGGFRSGGVVAVCADAGAATTCRLAGDRWQCAGRCVRD